LKVALKGKTSKSPKICLNLNLGLKSFGASFAGADAHRRGQV